LEDGGIMKKVVVRGPALSRSGYGEHCRAVLRALNASEEEYDLYLLNTNWGGTGWLHEDDEERRWIDSIIMKTVALSTTQPLNTVDFDLSIQVQLPSEWSKIGRKNIGVTAAIETTKASDSWVENVIGIDRVIVPSNHSRQCFSHSEEAKNNIEVVPFPVRDLEPTQVDLNLSTKFNFLSVATWCGRKNIEQTIVSFLQEFKDEEIGLILKTSIKNGSTIDRYFTKERLESLLSNFPEDRKCKIYLLHGSMTDSEMSSLYRDKRICCYVSTSHGEGFGLPMFEAAQAGMPVISPNWGGQQDFLSIEKNSKRKENLALTVKHDIAEVSDRDLWEDIIIKESKWCYPDTNSLKSRMREAYENPDKQNKRALKLQRHIKKSFTEDKIYATMNKIIKEVMSSEGDNENEAK
jgi:glycosyltransferase involved in cell wall biosynthesis